MLRVDEEYFISFSTSQNQQNQGNNKSLFQLLINRQKRLQQSPKKKLKSKKKRGKSKYWKECQNKLYVQFLKENTQQFHRPLAEKIKNRIHVQMSYYVRSKNPKQCRSHHQKMIEKYGNIEQIISHFLYQSLDEFMRKKILFDELLQSQFNIFPLELGEYDEKQDSIGSYV